MFCCLEERVIQKMNQLRKVKLKGNESFNFREGWLRKGMRCVQQYPDLFFRKDVMEQLGVGSKMVKSIRFWLQASGLCEERYVNGGRSREMVLTENFGKIVEQYDRYFDDIFTLFIIHYHIVSNRTLCIVWNIFFNYFLSDDFMKEDMIEMCSVELKKQMEENTSYSESLFADDCSSILKMYLNETEPEEPEESLSCPLAELGLLQRNLNKKNYIKAAPSREALDKMAVFYVIINNLVEDKTSVSIDDLLYGANNIGRVFNLNRVLINEYLDQLRVSGYLTLNRTAGLDMVYIDRQISPREILLDYYTRTQV